MLLPLLWLGLISEVAAPLLLTPHEDTRQEPESLGTRGGKVDWAPWSGTRAGGRVAVTASSGKGASVSSRPERGVDPLIQQMLMVGTGGAPGSKASPCLRGAVTHWGDGTPRPQGGVSVN